jgi:hypothetical protein
MFVRPEDVDRLFALSPGRAQRLAKRGVLPHYVLVDGSIRFRLDEVAELVTHRKIQSASVRESTVPRD